MNDQTSSADQLSGAAAKVGDELLGDVKSLKDMAKQKAGEAVDSRKGDVSALARSTSTAIESAADQMNEDAPAWLSTGFKQVAHKVSDLADALDNKSSGEIGHLASEFARNNPGTFLAASAATGFALARLLRAGAAHGSTPDGGASSAVDYPSPQTTVPAATNPYNASAEQERDLASSRSGAAI